MSLSGAVQLFPRDILAESTSAKEMPVGTLGQTTDGRKFRYCKAGASALAAGKLAVASTIVANHENVTVQTAAAIGATKVTVTLGATAATADQYTDGYMVVNDVTGEGITYRISGNPAADSAATLEVSLHDEIVVALTTSSQVTLLANPWNGAVISASDQADMAVGVAPREITAAYYGWIQTHGVCAGLADETLAVGSSLTIGSSVGGAFEVKDGAGEQDLGTAIQAGVDTEYRAVYLSID